MEETFDVLIIGGGIVGCAIVHKLSREGLKCVLLEKNDALASGASGGNSGMYHMACDMESDTLEKHCIYKGKADMEYYLKKLEIPHRKTGVIIVAATDEELQRLNKSYTIAKQNGINDAKMLTAYEVKNLEPNVSGTFVGGLMIPGETVVDSNLLTVSLAHHAKRCGAQVLCSQEVVSGRWLPQNQSWEIRTTSGGIFLAKTVINAAGLFGDLVDKMLLGSSSFHIKPRQGQFVVFEKAASGLLQHMLSPVGTEKSRGIIIFPSVYGNIVIGPTAEDTNNRENSETDEATISRLVQYGYNILPDLKKFKVVGTYSGLRPATEFSDFQIVPQKDRNYITVGGIRSTGLTASFGIADFVLQILQKDFQLQLQTTLLRPETIAIPWITNKPSYVLDGAEYTISHGLMKLGLFKSKL